MKTKFNRQLPLPKSLKIKSIRIHSIGGKTFKLHPEQLQSSNLSLLLQSRLESGAQFLQVWGGTETRQLRKWRAWKAWLFPLWCHKGLLFKKIMEDKPNKAWQLSVTGLIITALPAHFNVGLARDESKKLPSCWKWLLQMWTSFLCFIAQVWVKATAATSRWK